MNLELAFVDSIAASPTVRLNLHNDQPWRVLEGSRFDPPPLRYATSSTLLVDGEQISAAAFANRVITLRLMLQNVSEEQAATHLQTLARELNRATNFLRYRPGTTEPVFFRTKRCAPDSVTFDAVSKEVTVNVPAEPFALGLKETLPQVTVNNDPAAATNAMCFDLTGIRGDVETPLIMRLPADPGASGVGTNLVERYSYIAVRRRGTPANVPFALQAEAMNDGAGAAVQPNDAAMSGAGNNFQRTVFSVSSNARLVEYTHPATASPDNRGRYRALLRYRKSVAADSISVFLRWGGAAETTNHPWVNNDPVTLDATTDIRYADLGRVSIPYGPDPVAGLSGVEIPVGPAFFALFATWASGAGNLDWDVLLLLPADDRLAIIRWNADDFGPGPTFDVPESVVVDGTTDSIYWTDASGNVMPRPAAELAGALPMISPAVTNRVYFVRSGPGTALSDNKSNTTPIDCSYYPRYLYVRPAST